MASPPEEVDNLIGHRTLALLWVVDPRLITDSPSLSKLAAALGFSKAVLSNTTSQVTREFGVRHRAQVHGWKLVGVLVGIWLLALRGQKCDAWRDFAVVS